MVNVAGKIWRVSDGKYEKAYIRAGSLDEAKAVFDASHYRPGVEFQEIDHAIHAVYFTDGCDPAYFKGTVADARKGGNLYIRQWQLDAKIDRIVTI